MRKITPSVVVVLIIALVALGIALSYAQEQPKAKETMKETPKETPKEQRERTFAGAERGISFQFQQAKQNFMKKDMQAAASDIKKSATFLKMESERATEQSKKELADAGNELEKLAGEIEKGAIDSEKKLDEVFVKAYYALSRRDLDRAKEGWEKKESRRVARSLRAAANDLEQGIIASGQKVEERTSAVFKDARDASAKLSEGAELTADEISKLFENLGKEIEKFGQTIKPKESAEPAKPGKVEQTTEKVEKEVKKAGEQVEKTTEKALGKFKTEEKTEKSEK